MKRFTLILALVLMVAMPSFAEHVSSVTAQKAAATFLNNNGAKSTQITDLSKDAGFPNLYIFTTGQSFVVMSADDCVQPILGYSLTDGFITKDMPENLRWWLQGYNDQIQEAIDKGLPAEETAVAEWQSLKNGLAFKGISSVVVGPMLTTLWDQTYPYNYYCPACSNGGSGGHTYTGCVATAMAQVMKYWNYPTTGNGSHSYTHSTYGVQSANFGATTYDWAHMPNSLTSSSSQTNINAVATLMYHCGVAVEMNYGPSGSGAASSFVDDAWINYFRFSTATTYLSRDEYTDAQWIAFLKSELDDGRPLYYSGSNISSGHAFVCDGYRTDDYFHFNWGWSGYDGSYGSTHGNNGYWAIGALSPGSGGSGSGSGTYNLENAIIAWAEPLSDLAAPTLTATTSEGVATLTWNAIGGASSYSIYKDNVLLAEELTTTTYSDSDITFGVDYEYYVRAVSSTTRSNPSNFITVNSTYRPITPTNLTATFNNGTASLSWEGYAGGLSTDLHYGINATGGSYGYAGNYETYWAQKYPVSSISDFEGMYINKIAFYASNAGNYSLYLYKSNTSNTSNQLWTQSFAVTVPGWNEIVISSSTPIMIDATQDFWIVLHTGSEIPFPAAYSMYSGNNVEHARYLSTSLNSWYSVSDDISWCIKTYLTDGTFTYNLYDNNTLAQSGLSATSCTLPSLTANTAHQFTVKTAYSNGESSASNKAGITIGNASLNSLVMSANDQMIVTENSKLTVSGTISNNNPEHLILEDGAQLIHNSNGVKATVKKNIVPYTADDNGWYFIASPVLESITPSTANGLLNGVYDLYYYDEPTYYWMNYRNNAFNLTYKQGYLYASNANTPLQFAGTLAPSNSSININGLSYSSTILKGFNLVGNPFACNATVDQDCYIIDNNEGIVVLAEQTPIIAPCTGVFVKATASDNSVTFTKSTSAKGVRANNCLDLVITQGRSTADRARVRFGEGIGMEKYSMDDNHSQISLWQNGQDFAVAYANEGNEMPLNFKAAKNGTYTLSIEAEELGLDYLHLIDNLTGNDVNLLETPSYTFEAKTTDYASRFKLVYAPICEDADGDNAFAYLSDGNIIINNEDGATLQIVDMTGRVVFEGDATNRVSTSEMTSGVYILHLINGEAVHTQKIVVE